MATKQIDNFDQAYRDRIRDAVWDAILEASRDPATNTAPLRNCEIYDALLQLQAITWRARNRPVRQPKCA